MQTASQVYGTVALLDKIESRRTGKYPNWPETCCPEIVLTQQGCWLQVRAPHRRDTQDKTCQNSFQGQNMPSQHQSRVYVVGQYPCWAGKLKEKWNGELQPSDPGIVWFWDIEQHFTVLQDAESTAVVLPARQSIIEKQIKIYKSQTREQWQVV